MTRRQKVKVGVIAGPEAEVLDFVARRHPDLGLGVVRYPTAARVREALRCREVDAALVRGNSADRHETEQLRSFLRAGDAFAHVVESAPPKSWSASAARAERVEAWLGC